MTGEVKRSEYEFDLLPMQSGCGIEVYVAAAGPAAVKERVEKRLRNFAATLPNACVSPGELAKHPRVLNAIFHCAKWTISLPSPLGPAEFGSLADSLARFLKEVDLLEQVDLLEEVDLLKEVDLKAHVRSN